MQVRSGSVGLMNRVKDCFLAQIPLCVYYLPILVCTGREAFFVTRNVFYHV